MTHMTKKSKFIKQLFDANDLQYDLEQILNTSVEIEEKAEEPEVKRDFIADFEKLREEALKKLRHD